MNRNLYTMYVHTANYIVYFPLNVMLTADKTEIPPIALLNC